MGIKLDVSVETPLSDDDRDILAGISVMVLAIANREDLVDQAEEIRDEDDDTPTGGPLAPEEEPCGSADAEGRRCINQVGHPGRHKFHPLPDPGARMH